MKKGIIVSLAIVATGLFFSVTANGQDSTTAGQDLKNAAKKTGKAIKRTAKKVGNKTAELASKGKSAVVDKVYDGKQGPDGQTIYINDKSKYYWVDDKGHKQFIKASALRDKN